MTLQGIDQGGQKGNQSFGTDAIGGVPCQEQGLLDLWSVVGCSWALECVLHLRRMVEELSLLASIGQQIAVAVENGILYNQAEQSAAIAERQRLSRELHDSVTQSLYSVTMYAEAAARLDSVEARGARYCALPPYPTLIRGHFDPFQWAADPQRQSFVFDAGGSTRARASDTITGFAGAAGIVEGRARVIATAEEGDQLQTGEVLVTCVWYGLLEGKE